MELLIIRHAIAFERDSRRWREDSERPLSLSGIRRARKAAAGLKVITDPPDRLLSSPLLRARQTAQILTEIAGWPQAELAVELTPDKPPRALLSVLSRGRTGRVAVVGHQPALGKLLAACLRDDSGSLSIEMKKNAVACVSFQGTARPGHATLQWLATPRMLRALRKRR